MLKSKRFSGEYANFSSSAIYPGPAPARAILNLVLKTSPGAEPFIWMKMCLICKIMTVREKRPSVWKVVHQDSARFETEATGILFPCQRTPLKQMRFSSQENVELRLTEYAKHTEPSKFSPSVSPYATLRLWDKLKYFSQALHDFERSCSECLN